VWSIVLKEYRQRARGLATLGLIMTYTVILGLVSFFVYASSYLALAESVKTSGDVGLAMSVATFVTQMILALLLALSLNASTIAHEKDQETFDLLNLTLFKSYEIVCGKFFSSTGFLFILVVTALPIYALAFTFGGMSVEAFWQLAAVVVGMTLFISSLGVMFSLVSDDVRTALGRSFFALIVYGVVTLFFGWMLAGSLNSSPPNLGVYWVGTLSWMLNPMFAAIDVFKPWDSTLQWQTPLPQVVPWIVKSRLLWAFAAGAQVLCAAGLIAVTAFLYPRYRAGRSGNVGG
jgi:hypothetical protein